MIVFDLDRTLRNTDGSGHLAPSNPNKASNWVEWQNYVVANGQPIDATCQLYTDFVCSGLDVTILTSSQFGTKDWLEMHGLPLPSRIIERQHDDDRTSFDMKMDWVLNHAPSITLWVDDDVKMCDRVEVLGVLTVRVKGD